MYDYGVVGNCQINALISNRGSVDWLCLPQPDSPPVFGKLLDDDGGMFSIASADDAPGEQVYLTNTNILETTFVQKNGARFKITDFCPRFERLGRIYRPPMLIRIVTPLVDSPLIKVVCRGVDGWSKKPLGIVQGNSHIRFVSDIGGTAGNLKDQLRCTTNMPLTHLNSDQPFVLHEPLYFALTWGAPLESDLQSSCENFLFHTEKYWTTWVKHCSIPTLYQDQVIRSALILKLHCFEDTGAILASLTSSLPEEAGGVRNWDYRYCWLRDAYFSLTAFHNLGHFEEMEGFTRFLLNIAHQSSGDDGSLHPVYRLNSSLPLPESSHENWQGWRGSKPVRSGNEAATHVQNDVYGEMILSLAPIFFDERFVHLRNPNHRKLLERLASQCISSLGVADAGVWEFRNNWEVHSFSTLLSWAGIERVERMVRRGQSKFDLETLLIAKKKAEELISKATIDGSTRNSTVDPSFDASMALMPILRYGDHALSRKTIERLLENLAVKEDGKTPAFFYRYLKTDDFGKPQSAFLACSFWVAQGFAAAGDKDIARKIVDRTFESRNRLGLYAEHYDPITKVQLGNFPQAYSHVGLINSAFAVSPPWTEVL